jgi:hypothetical protein
VVKKYASHVGWAGQALWSKSCTHRPEFSLFSFCWRSNSRDGYHVSVPAIMAVRWRHYRPRPGVVMATLSDSARCRAGYARRLDPASRWRRYQPRPGVTATLSASARRTRILQARPASASSTAMLSASAWRHDDAFGLGPASRLRRSRLGAVRATLSARPGVMATASWQRRHGDALGLGPVSPLCASAQRTRVTHALAQRRAGDDVGLCPAPW